MIRLELCESLLLSILFYIPNEENIFCLVKNDKFPDPSRNQCFIEKEQGHIKLFNLFLHERASLKNF